MLLSAGPLLARSDTSSFERAKHAIETVTGEPFRKPVGVRPQNREDFLSYLKQQIRVAFSEGELSAFSESYALLGLLPNNYDLEKNLLDLYRSQAGAYYDPGEGVIRTLGGELSESQTYFIYLHELVHAHQDQYHGILDERHRIATQSFDAMNAFNFLIEGHANLVSMASQLGVQRLNDDYFNSGRHRGVFQLLTRFTDLDLSRMNIIEQLAGSSRLVQNLKMMQNTPDILVKQMIDPYFRGQYYWYERASASSWDRALNWLSDPPTETRRIIYRRADTAPAGGRANVPLETGGFTESMGVYFLLRWRAMLDKPPPWGRSLYEDRLALKRTGSDRYVAWEFHFGRSHDALQFFRSFAPEGTPPENEPIRTSVNRPYGTRYLSVHYDSDRVTLYVEDDPQREAYGKQ